MNIQELQETIATLPPGGLTTKTIRGKASVYHQWTKNGRQRSRIAKENELEFLRKSIQKRKPYRKRLACESVVE